MTYRDDLEAALERADDLERDLERERGAHARDEEKIKELERQLAEARKQAAHAKTKKEQPAKASPQDEAAKSGKRNMLWMVAGASALIVLLMYLGFTMYGGAPRKPAVPSSLPLMPRPPSASPSDPDQFDVTAGYFTALDLARKELPDAELTMLKAEFVDERGMAHLNYDGRARYNFRSPSRAAAPEPPANVPLGVPHPSTRPFCTVTLRARKGDPLRLLKGTDGEQDCGKSIPAPRCTVAEVWAEARKHGAPAGALASVTLDDDGWWIGIYDNG
ncbi:MAG TPA: hypothetical protein VFF06_04340, partial [Polyangia bacterium]|nr:hypothetical protein [Polyangia bacterium]